MRPTPRRFLTGISVATLATVLTAALGPVAKASTPAPEPHPAAPIGGCAVTQGVDTTYSAATR